MRSQETPIKRNARKEKLRRLLALSAYAPVSILFFLVIGNLLEDALRRPPNFDELTTLEGVVLSLKNKCGGGRRGREMGYDVNLSIGSEQKVIRVPCTAEFKALLPGTQLKLHTLEVRPHFNWPPYTEVWHASSSDKVIYSYDARLARTTKTRWIPYVLVVGMLLSLPMLWKLHKHTSNKNATK